MTGPEPEPDAPGGPDAPDAPDAQAAADPYCLLDLAIAVACEAGEMLAGRP